MNNLNQRERTLLILVLCTLPIFALYFGWTTYRAMLDYRQSELLAAQSEKENLELLAVTAEEEGERYGVYSAGSLPYDTQSRNELYSDHVLQLVRDAGLELQNNDQGRVTHEEVRSDEFDLESEVLFQRVRITDMKLRGGIEAFTKFLYAFYDSTILQRVDNVTILQDSKNKEEDSDLSITISVSGLVLPSGPESKPYSEYATGRTGKSFQEYKDLIIARNLFGPPNEAPKISSGLLSQEFNVGDVFRISNFSAKDSNGESLKFEILDSDLEDVALEQSEGSSTARLKGPKLEKPGSYQVKVRVADNRIPQMSDEGTIVVKVVEKKAEVVNVKPKKKVAGETYLTSMFENRNGEQILRMKNEDDRFELKLGESFKLDDASWKVIEFNLLKRQVTLQRDEEQMIYKLGSTLDQPIEQAEAVKASTEF